MKNRQKLKGSVLFTVVAVMMVVLVFVMSALTIAGATSRRAYSDYAKAQTQYTARSAIEATITHLQNSTDFAKKIKNLNNKGDSFDVTVAYKEDSASLPSDTINVKVELVSKDYQYTDDQIHDVVSITASSSLLGENSSVSLFLLKDSPSSSAGGFGNALTTLGGFNTEVGKITSYGGSSLNLYADSTDDEQPPLYLNENNGAVYRGNMLYNSTVKYGTASVYNYILSKNLYGVPDGIVCYGDFIVERGINIQSEVNYDGAPVDADGKKIVKLNEVPYIFIERTLNLSGDSGNASADIGAPGNGVNIFCNQLIATSQQTQNIYADSYIWASDPDYDSLIQNFKDYNDFAVDYYNYIGEEGENYEKTYSNPFIVGSNYSYHFKETNKYLSKIGNNGGTQLLQWAGDIINGDTSKEYGGNIFTKGSLCFGGQSTVNGDVTAEQGVYMSNMKRSPWGMELKEAVRINGRLTVGGVLLVDNQNDRNSYVESLCISSPDSVIIKGKGLQVGDKVYNTTEEFINACNITDPVDPNYNPNIIVNSDMAKNTFPSVAEKDNVTSFISGKGEAIRQHVQKDKDGNITEYTNLKHRSDFSAAESITYTANNFRVIRDDGTGNTDDLGRDVIINESCTISGAVNGVNITFDASSGSNLYVILDNVSFQNRANFYINSNGGDVHFFTETPCRLDNTKIITTNYKEAIENNQEIDILETPGDMNLLAESHISKCTACQVPGWEDKSSSAYAESKAKAKAHITDYHIKYNCSKGCSNETDVENHLKESKKWMPNVYFYMDEGGSLEIINGESLITAYVYAPKSDITLSNTKRLNNVTYNGKSIPSNTSFSIIGSTTANNVYPGTNEEAFFFIDPSGASSGITDADGGTWFPMYYQNSSDVE